jgi:protein-tyrosine phosphatase
LSAAPGLGDAAARDRAQRFQVLDLHFVAPGLAVGSRFPMELAARLAREHGIARVIDVRVEDRDDEAILSLHGIRLLHLPTRDCCAISQRRLEDGVAFAAEGLDRGDGVLIHCQWGIGRSALLALCVLVARGAPPLEAMEQAKSARPVISPSPEQLEALLAFSARWRARARAGWTLPTLEQLGAIAWRHLYAEDPSPGREAVRAASTRSEREERAADADGVG